MTLSRNACEILPLAEARALDPAFYQGDDWLAFEQREIFSRSWQLAAHADDLAAPGDHVVVDIAGASILLAHGTDGVLRGFRNACRHRAGPVAACSGKGAKRFRCAYHGWTYELDGRLRAAPEMQDAADFDVADVALHPVHVRLYEKLVFVALRGDAPSFDEVFGGVAERMAGVDIKTFRFERREVWPVAANWKTYVDNFLEGYHVPVVHPALSDVIDYGKYTSHLERWHSLQTAPVEDDGAVYGGDAVYYWFFFPNIMLNVVKGRVQTNRVIPDGPGRCLVEFVYYCADDAETRARVAADATFSAKVQEEDRLICETVQKNLTSGGYRPGRLSPKREAAVWHFQNLLRTAYAKAMD
ncbi:MAG: aromatic ring-hydroxylating dioxygenase subunit alpha [Parvularculaceae bacterium]|nr:aromatic ring-hydroxylating dioxygenase subunit alpha [Parvularculaceae bacterium]